MADLAQLTQRLHTAFGGASPVPGTEPRQDAPAPAGNGLGPRFITRCLGCLALLALVAVTYRIDPSSILPFVLGLVAGLAIYSLLPAFRRNEQIQPGGSASVAQADAARAAAERASLDKSRLLATVAHDLRTPLTGLLGMADLLGQSRLTADQRNYVAGMRQSGQMLSHLVEDLLDYATMEAGCFELRPVPTSPRRLIETTVEMLASPAHHKGLEIASVMAPDVPDCLHLDSARLRQVLYNLVGNAVKFTRAGGVLISARMEDDHLVVAVADTGPGMSPADRERIFQEFVQVGAPGSRADGRGLGLSISARIVRAFGGSMEVDSEPGKGSTFTIRIPTDETAEVEQRAAREQAMAASAVLLLAPHGPAAEAIRRTIVALGGACLVCDGSASALDILAAAEIQGSAITDIVIDHRLEDVYLRDLAQRAEALQIRRVFLVNPEERQSRISGPYDAWLIRPLREQSLIDVMSGRLRGLERRGATNDNMPIRGWDTVPISESRPFVLLGEDDPVNALLARTALERADCRVLTVGNFPALLGHVSAAARPLPDLIVTDLHMPGGGFEDLVRALRRSDGSLSIPVIVLSGEPDPEVLASPLRSGAVAVLAKPVLPGDLARHVRAALSHAAQADDIRTI
jgi:signal transduction histidine kinase/CheY-like chemotaxis protein